MDDDKPQMFKQVEAGFAAHPTQAISVPHSLNLLPWPRKNLGKHHPGKMPARAGANATKPNRPAKGAPKGRGKKLPFFR